MENSHEIFNLQLAVQHLEAELSLYRNGTSGSDLLVIIAERDAEIDALKTNLSETTEKLRKIAKGSQEVLAKCAIFQSEKAEKQEEVVDLLRSLEESTASNAILNSENADLKSQIAELTGKCEDSAKLISDLEEQLSDRNESIVKLQARCAQLVGEKSEKSKLLEKEKHERSKQVSEFRVRT